MSAPGPSAERAIAVAPGFERVWPLVAPRLRELWPEAAFVRTDPGGASTLSSAVPGPGSVRRLLGLGVPVDEPGPSAFDALEATTVPVDSASPPTTPSTGRWPTGGRPSTGTTTRGSGHSRSASTPWG